MPSSTIAAQKISGRWWMAMKSLARTFSPPPRKSVTTWPLSWNPGRTGRPPPPMWLTTGTFSASSMAQSGWWSGCVGDTTPRGRSVGTITAAQPSSIARRAHSTVRSGHAPRHRRDREHPIVVATECRHRPVQRVGAAIQQVDILAGELGGGERREHELCGESECVEDMAALGGFEGADRSPPLGVQQLDRVVGERHRTGGGPLGGLGHGAIGQRTRPAEREWTQLFACRVVGELLEPAREFHHMTVGVEHDAIPCIRHARERIAPRGRVEPRRVRRC